MAGADRPWVAMSALRPSAVAPLPWSTSDRFAGQCQVLQQDLRQLAASADTSSSTGLQRLRETTLALLRLGSLGLRQPGNGNVPFAAAESTFNRLSMTERSKLREGSPPTWAVNAAQRLLVPQRLAMPVPPMSSLRHCAGGQSSPCDAQGHRLR